MTSTDVTRGDTTSTIETVQAFSDALLAGDVAKAQELLAPDVLIDEPVTLPYGGERKGHEGFLAMLGEIGERLSFEVLEREFHDAGAFVVAKMQTRWSSQGGESSVETPYVELYTVSEGLITRVDIYPKDPKLIADLWE